MTHFNYSPTNIYCNNIKQISKYFRESKTYLKDTKREATNHREVHLNQLTDEEYVLGNIKHTRYLCSLITIKQQAAIQRKTQSFKKVNDKSGLKEIAIPKDKTINWNTMSKHSTDDQW